MGKDKTGLFPMCVSHELKDLSDIPHRDIPETDLAVVAGYRKAEDAPADIYADLTDGELIAVIGKDKPSFRLDTMASLLGFCQEDEEEGSGIYVLGTESRYFGASVLGYPEELVKACQQLEEGFYVLPSSIHEVILLPDSKAVGIAPKELQQMVSEINQQQVREEERLSNSVYHFDGEKLTAVAGPAVEKEEDANDGE